MVKECFCSKCGKKFDIWDCQEDFRIHRQLGYGTKYDGDKLELNLCCKCVEELIDTCVLNPIIDNE